MMRPYRDRLPLHAAFTLAAIAFLSLAAAPAVAAEDGSALPPALSSSSFGSSIGTQGSLLPLLRGIDLSRLSWNHELHFGFSSGGPQSGPAGLYTSSLGYRLADPLRLQVDLGAHLTPGLGRGLDQGLFLQGMTLDWRPGGDSWIRIQYQNYRSPLQTWGSPHRDYADPRYEPFRHVDR